ncbi:methylmalonyl Co-A mutase-associated GTPase MeaB [Dyadobacter pollutisoli]|jgi:LAO/AO transport system kinase|uniref:Methylmalonyl Co-A mutase-associated GTPase MeaB n=1 Tax=Dyadobacter pollutisoli TaxID=2910158 RepID=A0A9E8N9C4_9BACT|nr:methylmalonyl Co-A mutase-associated GTPase MeaB [Dyadobacter pollutisoli]WAC11158.1 methylmalonyl Co-A mutase-associated GTPase MeaB [Dyadobacter pollutisoli]
MRQRLSVAEYTRGILAGDRTLLGRAITVIESKLAEDKVLATEILQSILPMTGKALRIGITGVPGVGKSTFIETFGQYLTSSGKRVAVLAIDPSSKKSGGSILGDKTRMENLAHSPHAFIRPSATGLSLGGVARSTRETILLCEAAGYDIILVETVGVGQSETLVKGMTDFFLLLMLAGAGDELQGIKRGIMEMVDSIAINKADGTNQQAAALAVNEYQNALHHLPGSSSGFVPKVIACSALEGSGIDAIWQMIQEYEVLTRENGFFAKNRQFQNLDWLHDHIRQNLEDQFYGNAKVKAKLSASEEEVREGQVLPATAAQQLINLFLGKH